jgi:hypothetical protein
LRTLLKKQAKFNGGYWIVRPREKGEKMDFEGYCVKCREKKAITGGKVEETKNGRRMAKGTCPTCGTKVSRFLPQEK